MRCCPCILIAFLICSSFFEAITAVLYPLLSWPAVRAGHPLFLPASPVWVMLLPMPHAAGACNQQLKPVL